MAISQVNFREDMVPILRSSAVMRPEHFGGFVFNHFLPPELKFDRIRYNIACRCNGKNTVHGIQNYVRKKTIHSEKYVKEIVRDTLYRLENSFLLYWRNDKIEPPLDITDPPSLKEIFQKHLSAPISLIWELTHACNLKCKHCFSSSGRHHANELSTDEIKQNIDLFAENRILYINFTGGEPLLRSDLFEILNYASTKKIFFDFSTNGNLITQKTISQLKETKISQVQVSIDGLEATHDYLRGVRGAFKRALKAIKRLIQAELEVAISCTVNRTNVSEVPELIDLALAVGASSFKTTLFNPIGQGKCHQNKLMINSSDVQSISLIMAQKRKELNGRLSVMLNSCYPWLVDESQQTKPDWLRSEYTCCAAGTSTLFITSNGDVVPCPFLREYVIGNVRKDKFDDIWKSKTLDIFRKMKPVDLKGKCKACVYLGDQCFGGCRAAALAYSNDIYAEDPFCWKNMPHPKFSSAQADGLKHTATNAAKYTNQQQLSEKN